MNDLLVQIHNKKLREPKNERNILASLLTKSTWMAIKET